MSCYNVGQVSDYLDRAKSQKLRFTGPPAKVERLLRLADSHDPNRRAVAAGSPLTPLETLYALAIDDDQYVRSWAVRNPAATTDLLTLLTYDEDNGIAAYAAFLLGVNDDRTA